MTDIERTTLDVFVPEDKDAFRRRLAEQAELGFDTSIFSVSDPTDRKIFDLLGRGDRRRMPLSYEPRDAESHIAR